MVKAIWNEVTLADSPEAVRVDGYYYFPRSSVRSKYLRASDRTTTCPHKGVAHYFDIAVGESVNANAA